MVCKAPFYPNRRNYTSDCEHDGNSRKSWFLVLHAGLFTKKMDAEHEADVSGSLSSPSARAQRRRLTGRPTAANFTPTGATMTMAKARKRSTSHPALPPLRRFRPLPRSTTWACSAPANAVRASVKREVRASAKREPPVKDDMEEAKTPLFREDGEVSPLSRHASTQRTCRVSPPSTTGSISSVSSLSASVGSSASRTAPPLRSLPRYPPSSRPAAPHLHAGGSASTGAGAQSCCHAELPVLFNNSTRTLYKDAATAVREMGKEDSIQVLEVEDRRSFFPPPRAAA
ncbi:hypothetical protein B0H13DRAFT_2394384 [Mycena leptocephala]|nr:hypothetical protein B0H13DRAFT_2394384 [Mycena leptocephala]